MLALKFVPLFVAALALTGAASLTDLGRKAPKVVDAIGLDQVSEHVRVQVEGELVDKRHASDGNPLLTLRLPSGDVTIYAANCRMPALALGARIRVSGFKLGPGLVSAEVGGVRTLAAEPTAHVRRSLYQ